MELIFQPLHPSTLSAPAGKFSAVDEFTAGEFSAVAEFPAAEFSAVAEFPAAGCAAGNLMYFTS